MVRYVNRKIKYVILQVLFLFVIFGFNITSEPFGGSINGGGSTGFPNNSSTLQN